MVKGKFLIFLCSVIQERISFKTRLFNHQPFSIGYTQLNKTMKVNFTTNDSVKTAIEQKEDKNHEIAKSCARHANWKLPSSEYDNTKEGSASTSNDEARKEQYCGKLISRMVELCREYGFAKANAHAEGVEPENYGWFYDTCMRQLLTIDAEGAEDYLMRQFMDKYADVYGEDVCEKFLNNKWYDLMMKMGAFSDGIEDCLGKQTKIVVMKRKLTDSGISDDAVQMAANNGKEVHYEPARATYTVMLRYADGADKKITIKNFPVLENDEPTIKEIVRHLIPSLSYNAKEHRAFQQKVQDYVYNHMVVKSYADEYHYNGMAVTSSNVHHYYDVVD